MKVLGLDHGVRAPHPRLRREPCPAPPAVQTGAPPALRAAAPPTRSRGAGEAAQQGRHPGRSLRRTGRYCGAGRGGRGAGQERDGRAGQPAGPAGGQDRLPAGAASRLAAGHPLGRAAPCWGWRRRRRRRRAGEEGAGRDLLCKRCSLRALHAQRPVRLVLPRTIFSAGLSRAAAPRPSAGPRRCYRLHFDEQGAEGPAGLMGSGWPTSRRPGGDSGAKCGVAALLCLSTPITTCLLAGAPI